MPKSTLSQDKLQILESMWAEGVHSYRSETDRLKVKQVAAATGLVVEQVKVWIYNRNRKQRKSHEGQTKREWPGGALQTHSLSTEGLMSGDVGRTTSTPDSAEEATPSEAGREDSNRELDSEQEPERGEGSSCSGEQQEKEQERGDRDQDLEQRGDMAAELMQAVEDQVHKLHACNCEVLVMVYNHSSGSLYTSGTPKGLDFLNSQTPAVHWQFSGAMTDSSPE